MLLAQSILVSLALFLLVLSPSPNKYEVKMKRTQLNKHYLSSGFCVEF